jgi:16S rRNA (uracil1498-N3)-methyltransferase
VDVDRAPAPFVTLRAPIVGLAEGEQVLGSEASHYLCRVRRLGVGDVFVGFDPEARTEADITILEASATAARAKVEALRPARVVAQGALVLVYALAKGDKVDDVIRDATELGATRIVVARTERAVVKLSGDRATEKLDRWRRIAEQAARQCGRADPPAIDGVFDWEDALDATASCEARFCLDPHASLGLGGALVPHAHAGASLAFAIGPEGGLAPAEVEAARAKGFLPTSLGAFVLRTETVAAAVLGAVRVLTST